ncbi:hypothetical protein HPB47_015732 [Ixodes persulcatus]|uniref:Uncharacterized protein n=1 Tax=Ixodes persulcatus TaxID=34615 RepID=A0AC60QUP6_IXOPE|nr:hypothetical protein HPB47_015732 [Ixodes persulcatus]
MSGKGLRVLRAHINHLNVKVIYTDFELAAMNSFQNQFSGVRLQACFFHLAQSVYRKVQENHDLRQRYDTDKGFSVLGDLDAAFDSLMEIFPDEAMPLAQYFEDTYLGRRRGLRRILPMFAPSLWNVNDVVHRHLPHTNNSAEAWHREFQSTVACASPTIWAFLAALKKEQAVTEMKLAQASVGHAARMPKRKYQDCNIRIENIYRSVVRPVFILKSWRHPYSTVPGETPVVVGAQSGKGKSSLSVPPQEEQKDNGRGR